MVSTEEVEPAEDVAVVVEWVEVVGEEEEVEEEATVAAVEDLEIAMVEAAAVVIWEEVDLVAVAEEWEIATVDLVIIILKIVNLVNVYVSHVGTWVHCNHSEKISINRT